MEYAITFGGQPQDVTQTLVGTADVASIVRCNAELGADKRFRSGLAILVDASALDAAPLAGPGLEAASHSVAERDWEHPPLAVAILVANRQAAEIFKHWRAYLGGSQSRRRVFTSRAEALAWLAAEKAARVLDTT